MRRVFWILFFCLPFGLQAQRIPPIGYWREHLPWNNASHVAIDGDMVISATPYGLFNYDQSDRSFQRWSRINGLNETGVSAMAYDPISKSTILVYKNSNLDVLVKNKVINIPDIRISNVPGNKSVQSITIHSGKAYLSAGLGVIVVDLSKYLILDTWRIGGAGKEISVHDLVFTSSHRIAATEDGLKISVLTQDPSDYRNWVQLGKGSFDELATHSNMVFARKGDSLFKVNNGLIYINKINGITGMDFINGALMVLSRVGDAGRLTELNADGIVQRVVTPQGLSYPLQAVAQGSSIWIADLYNGLSKLTGNSLERIFPNSPINIASGEMIFSGKELWATAGAVNSAWNYQYNPNGIYHLKEDQQWEGINLYVTTKLDSLLDFITVAAVPSGSVYFGSYGGGLVELKNGKDLIIHKQNSPLQPAAGDPRSYRVSGLAVDENGNVWVSNFGAAQNIHVRKKDGSWRSFVIPFLHTENAVAGITIDDEDQKWIISPKGNGLFLLNSGKNIDNANDDQWRFYRYGKGNGNLPSNTVNCTAKDRNGFIWVGTDKGIGVITCTDKATSSTCEAIWPIIQQDGFAGYLFQNEDVRAIAVDGANRKWVGTRNGLWLVNADGEKIIHQFTVANSPLLSNEINSLAIDPNTGEVFVASASGICSFRSTATEPIQQNKEILVFPNPVPPGFAGTIGIRGLPEHALVKITELDGRLVYQTRSLGGQAVWNGRDSKGNKVSSGVYLVLISDEKNVFKLTTKIFFIR